MADNPSLHAEAADPATDPARLAAIAAQEHTLGAVVALNPAAYDGLLDWIAEFGDEAAKRAVALRRGAPPPPAPSAPPPPPEVSTQPAAAPLNPFEPGAPLPQLTPFGADAPAPAAPQKKRMPRRVKRGILVGVIGTLVLLLAAGAGIAYLIIYGLPVPPAVQNADVRSKPSVVWELVSPVAEEVDYDKKSTLRSQVITVGQNRALVIWTNDRDSDDSMLSLVDTASGSALWSVEWELTADARLLSELGATPFVLETGEGVVSIDAADGGVIADNEASRVRSVAVNALDGALGIGSDVMLVSKGAIGRYGADDLDDPKWEVDIEGERYALVRDRLIVGEDAYDLTTGERVSWSGSEGLEYYSYGHMMLGVLKDHGTVIYYRLNLDGKVFWKERTKNTELAYFDSEVLVFRDTARTELTALGFVWGDTLWSEDFDAYTNIATVSRDAGVMILGIEGDDPIALDVRSGVKLYELDVRTGDLRGIASTMFVAAAGDELIGFDLRSGDELWGLDVPDGYWTGFAGGNLIGVTVTTADDAKKNPTLIGIR